MRVAAAAVLVWPILFVVPFVIYGVSSAAFGLKRPAGPVWAFLAAAAVSKLGTAIAFTGVFALTREVWRGRWLLYAGIWFLMFAMSEIGDALKPGYGAVEAGPGVLSEAVYTPLSAFVTARVFR
jgi:hypothetical protein